MRIWGTESGESWGNELAEKRGRRNQTRTTGLATLHHALASEYPAQPKLSTMPSILPLNCFMIAGPVDARSSF